MKRLLAILTLLAALLAPGLAQATSFVFGSVFNDEMTLGENLAAMAGSLDAFTLIEGTDVDTSAKYTFTGIGYSQRAVNAGFNISDDTQTIASAGMGFELTPDYSADELTFHFTDYVKNKSIDMLLSDLLLDQYYVKEIYVLNEALDVMIGDEKYTFVAGTIFFSFTVPNVDGYKNEIDFIMAMSPNAVPVPAAAWLLGSGLAGLLTLRRKLR